MLELNYHRSFHPKLADSKLVRAVCRLLHGIVFPAEVIHAAQNSKIITGCPASTTLAQWALESGYGRFMPANSNNPFGIKWTALSHFPYIIANTTEVVKGKFIHTTARFVKYPDLVTAFNEHGRLLMNPRGYYHNCTEFAGVNNISFVQCIAPIYATDPGYGAKLISIIKAHNLTQYD